jgi:hypothetical protein
LDNPGAKLLPKNLWVGDKDLKVFDESLRMFLVVDHSILSRYVTLKKAE